jgi:hypothetical protein
MRRIAVRYRFTTRPSPSSARHRRTSARRVRCRSLLLAGFQRLLLLGTDHAFNLLARLLMKLPNPASEALVRHPGERSRHNTLRLEGNYRPALIRGGPLVADLLLQSSPGEEHMPNLKGLESVILQLREQRTDLVNQLRHVEAALSVLGKLDGGRFYTQPRSRKMSAAARARISASQKARWARTRGQKVVSIAPKRRHISAAGLANIRAAQRARWAKIRRQK